MKVKINRSKQAVFQRFGISSTADARKLFSGVFSHLDYRNSEAWDVLLNSYWVDLKGFVEIGQPLDSKPDWLTVNPGDIDFTLVHQILNADNLDEYSDTESIAWNLAKDIFCSHIRSLANQKGKQVWVTSIYVDGLIVLQFSYRPNSEAPTVKKPNKMAWYNKQRKDLSGFEVAFRGDLDQSSSILNAA